MIVRAILQRPDEIIGCFDFFNDFRDTSDWLRSLYTEKSRAIYAKLVEAENAHRLALKSRDVPKNTPRLTTVDCERAVALLAAAREQMIRVEGRLTWDEHNGEVGQVFRYLIVAMKQAQDKLRTVQTVD